MPGCRAAVLMLLLVSSFAFAYPTHAQDPTKPRDPVADAAKIDESTKVMLEGDYRARLKACGELVLLPAGSKAQEDLLLDKALPACAADPEWRLRAAAAVTVGERSVWRAPQQPPDPRAVALCVKLAGDEHPKVRYNAVYYGLSPMRPKPDEVVAVLVKAAVAAPAQGDGSDVLGRVAWGLQGVPPGELLPHVEPYLKNHAKAPDQAKRAYALFVATTKTEPPGAENIEGGGPFIVQLRVDAPVGGDPKAALDLIRQHVPAELAPVVFIEPFQDSAGAYVLARDIRTRRAVVEKLKGVEHVEVRPDVIEATPQMVERITQASKAPPRKPPPRPRAERNLFAEGKDPRDVLLQGDSKTREEAFRQIRHSSWLRLLTEEEAGLDVLEACAADPSPAVRKHVAGLLGAWVWSRQPQHPRGVALALKLSADPDPGVRYDAIYHGLSTVKSPMADEVTRALVAAAMAQQPFDDLNLHGRIAWGLREEKPDRLAPFFAAHLKDPDLARATTAYALFVQATAHEPPGAERFAPVARFLLWFGQTRDSKHDAPDKLLKAFRAYAPEDKVPEVAVYQNGDYAQGAAVVSDLAVLRDVAGRIQGDPELHVEPRPYVLLPRRLSFLRAQLAKDPRRTISTIKLPSESTAPSKVPG